MFYKQQTNMTDDRTGLLAGTSKPQTQPADNALYHDSRQSPRAVSMTLRI